VTCEKICGIARLIRSLAAPALENVISWEERDISHSSTERFVIPQAFILTDYIVREMNRVVAGLTIDESAVKRNLELSNGSILSEFIVTQLTLAGMDRPVAHSILREVSQEAAEQGRHLLDVASTHPRLSGVIDTIRLDLERYYESIREVSREIVRRAVDQYRVDIWHQDTDEEVE